MLRIWIRVGLVRVLLPFILVVFCRKLPNELDPDKGTPGIVIEKTTNGEDADYPPGPAIEEGETVTWNYIVRNVGNVTLTDIRVTDNREGNIGTIFSLTAGAFDTLMCTGTASVGQYSNVATAHCIIDGCPVSERDTSHYHGYIDYSAFYRDSSHSVIVSMPIPSDITLPPAQLPWPHQPPGISQPAYYQHIKDLWLFDNFGTYWGGEWDNIKYLYFHDGLDIMLPNGTKFYAIEPGYVKSVRGEGTNYGCITVGETEGDAPGWGWEYAHTGNFQFRVGDYVQQGEYIADVKFMEHIHLSRIRVSDGSWNDKRDREYYHPDRFFLYEDTMPPIVKTPFYYFQNNSDESFENTYPAVVSGNVDIVVAMRDLSEACMTDHPGYILRHCVSRIEYEITGENIQPVFIKSFDFSKIIFHEWPGSMYDRRVYLIYKDHQLPILQSSDLDRAYGPYSFYIITNTDGTGEFGYLDMSAEDFAWQTAGIDESGDPLFPNGVYTVTVTAYDFLGNYTVASETVVVNNPYSCVISR